jgi:hypothetical protein
MSERLDQNVTNEHLQVFYSLVLLVQTLYLIVHRLKTPFTISLLWHQGLHSGENDTIATIVTAAGSLMSYELPGSNILITSFVSAIEFLVSYKFIYNVSQSSFMCVIYKIVFQILIEL